MRKLWIAFVGMLVITTGATVAYAATPGWHRALTPGWFAMTKVAPDIWIDDPTRTETARDLIATAQTRAEQFFGARLSNPTYIFCTTDACAARFGLRPRGLTVGYHVVLTGPKGFNRTILSHEQIHADLHSFLGLRDIWHQRYPAWFDEGLASYLSPDPRYLLPDNPRDADWIKTAHSPRDWNRLHATHHWRDTYGAAARLVSEIDETLGRDGLRALVKEVAGGADFDATLDRHMARPLDPAQ